MRYIVNFKIIILGDKIFYNIIRSFFTTLEKDIKKYNLLHITKVKYWFKELFKEKPIDHYIGTIKVLKIISLNMKIGRKLIQYLNSKKNIRRIYE
tara:strand:- start:38 stop:322 length:285 start_codon:yes stop_codon:yes gene_type:complete